MTHNSPEIEFVAKAIKAAWQTLGEVPFPLYELETLDLARAAIQAVDHYRSQPDPFAVSRAESIRKYGRD